jgi:hypothetical protein
MTQDEIIEMARQAGLEVVIQQSSDGLSKTVQMPPIKPLEAFAKLVEAHTRGKMLKPDWDNYRQGLIDGATAEREACAVVCDDKQYVHPYHDLGTLIRARGES